MNRFLHTERTLDRLKLLIQMNIVDAVVLVLEKQGPGSGYLLRRLKRYKDMVDAKAFQKYTKSEWDSVNKKYLPDEEEEEEEISSEPEDEDIKPENLALGLLRDTLYAEMIGTPEMAAVKIATKRINERRQKELEAKKENGEQISAADFQPIRGVIEFFGYYSGIFQDSLGMYKNLCELYEKNYQHVYNSYKGKGLSYAQIEHRAVLMTAKMLEDAYRYAGQLDTCASPSNPRFKEAIAVGRLGSEHLKRRIKGMRRRTYLDNIGRFIGKSGDDKYGREARKLYWELEKKVLFYSIEEKEEWTLKKNVQDLARLTRQFHKKEDALMSRFERKKEGIFALELPEQERELQLASVTTKYEEELRQLTATYQAESERIRARTFKQLFKELKERQEKLEIKHAKHKNLAEKAIDLHFVFKQGSRKRRSHNSEYEEAEKFPVETPRPIIDWINEAPFGTIKRAHTLLQKGASIKTILAFSIADIVAGKNGLDRTLYERVKNEVDTIWSLYEQSKEKWEQANNLRWDDPNKEEATKEALHVEYLVRDQTKKLSNWVSVALLLQRQHIDASLDVIEDIASKNYSNLDKFLKEFSLDEVRELLDEEASLSDVLGIRGVMESRGYTLTIPEIKDLARSFDTHEYLKFFYPRRYKSFDEVKWVLERSLQNFGLKDTKKLLSSNINAYQAVKINGILKKHGYSVSIPEIIDICNEVPLYYEFDDFNNWEHWFDEALSNLPLSDVKNWLQEDDMGVRHFIEILNVLREHRVHLGFNTIQRLASHLKPYEVSELPEAFRIFSPEEIETILSDGVDLHNAVAIKRKLINKSVPLDGLHITKKFVEVLESCAHKNAVELFSKAIQAGFKQEDIENYPFLLSPLITQMGNEMVDVRR